MRLAQTLKPDLACSRGGDVRKLWSDEKVFSRRPGFLDGVEELWGSLVMLWLLLGLGLGQGWGGGEGVKVGGGLAIVMHPCAYPYPLPLPLPVRTTLLTSWVEPGRHIVMYGLSGPALVHFWPWTTSSAPLRRQWINLR